MPALWVWLAVLLAVVSGCATPGDEGIAYNRGDLYQQPASFAADRATLYIYRPDAPYERDLFPDVLVDGLRLGGLQNNTYLLVELAGGEHVVEVQSTPWGNWTLDPVIDELELQRGAVYYLRMVPHETGGRVLGRPNEAYTELRMVPGDLARRELAGAQRMVP